MTKEDILKIQKDLEKDFKEITNLTGLEELRLKYTGKKGSITEILSKMNSLSIEDKKVFGKLINEVKTYYNDNFNQINTRLTENVINEKLRKESIDVTLPGTKIKKGSKHPINMVIEEIEDLFVSMGYDVVEGFEVEDDYHCFELLNLPKGHPARDMQDSFYINNEMLLRTHTSPMQTRVMLANKEKTPIRIICPGKVYRKDDDATHSHQFTQIEGLIVDKKISLADLKGTLEVLAKKLLGNNTEVRFRPSYFPFTEPSYEVDVSCFKCNGKGCSLCKNTGWIEILGSGVVHPNVLRDCGYDPEQYTGFAFGLGIERVAMFKYGIPDIRYFYTNDYRFLNNFNRKEDE